MSQLSLFSADLTPPQLSDLGGLLAAHGQIVTGVGGVRLSILLADSWRAEALLRECRVRDVGAEVIAGADRVVGADPIAATVFRSQFSELLAGLAQEWTRGAVKAVPAGLTLTPGLLRCWTIAAGHPADIGFLLGLDPHAPDTYEPLAAVCAAAGLAGSLLGVRGGGPAVRIVGYRRCARLAEMIGTPPPEAPRGAFPALSH
ncbi:MAG TPA: hypothetical protein VFC16_11925 [Nakamurella sp.]|nr:hypothetical protein [Nakamurella sp.]